MGFAIAVWVGGGETGEENDESDEHATFPRAPASSHTTFRNSFSFPTDGAWRDAEGVN